MNGVRLTDVIAGMLAVLAVRRSVNVSLRSRVSRRVLLWISFGVSMVNLLLWTWAIRPRALGQWVYLCDSRRLMVRSNRLACRLFRCRPRFVRLPICNSNRQLESVRLVPSIWVPNRTLKQCWPVKFASALRQDRVCSPLSCLVRLRNSVPSPLITRPTVRIICCNLGACGSLGRSRNLCWVTVRDRPITQLNGPSRWCSNNVFSIVSIVLYISN